VRLAEERRELRIDVGEPLETHVMDVVDPRLLSVDGCRPAPAHEGADAVEELSHDGVFPAEVRREGDADARMPEIAGDESVTALRTLPEVLLALRPGVLQRGVGEGVGREEKYRSKTRPATGVAVLAGGFSAATAGAGTGVESDAVAVGREDVASVAAGTAGAVEPLPPSASRSGPMDSLPPRRMSAPPDPPSRSFSARGEPRGSRIAFAVLLRSIRKDSPARPGSPSRRTSTSASGARA